jgi:hypothetical protein
MNFSWFTTLEIFSKIFFGTKSFTIFPFSIYEMELKSLFKIDSEIWVVVITLPLMLLSISHNLFILLKWRCESISSNIDIESCGLYLQQNVEELEFEQLSDGEYQLLSIYALIDLFDSENTIFLFDEIDSHLHFNNINKLI